MSVSSFFNRFSFFRYLAAAKVGDSVIIDADTIKLGRTLAFLKVSIIRKEDNVVLAQGTHTKFIK